MKTILSLDPSPGTTGYAIAIDGAIMRAGFMETSETVVDGERWIEAGKWLLRMIEKWHPDVILIEDFFFSGTFANGANTNSEIRGIYKAVSALKKIPYVVMNQSEWKSLVAGRSTPTKQQVQAWTKQKAKKKFIVEALKIKHGIDCPSKILNQQTNRPNDFKFDVSDAIGILIAYFLKEGIGYNTAPITWDFTVIEESNEGILRSRGKRSVRKRGS